MWKPLDLWGVHYALAAAARRMEAPYEPVESVEEAIGEEVRPERMRRRISKKLRAERLYTKPAGDFDPGLFQQGEKVKEQLLEAVGSAEKARGGSGSGDLSKVDLMAAAEESRRAACFVLAKWSLYFIEKAEDPWDPESCRWALDSASAECNKHGFVAARGSYSVEDVVRRRLERARERREGDVGRFASSAAELKVTLADFRQVALEFAETPEEKKWLSENLSSPPLPDMEFGEAEDVPGPGPDKPKGGRGRGGPER